MNLITILFFSATVILQTSGQVLEKIGLSKIPAYTGISDLISIQGFKYILTSPYIMGGIACSGLGLIFWLGALSNAKLSYLFPLGSISYILVALASFLFIKEQITIIQAIGIMVIVCGCFLLNK